MHVGLRDEYRAAVDWLLGRDEPRPPSPERTVEAAWIPLWQSQMITDELVAQGVPAVVTEDYAINPMMTTRQTMARIFVTEDRLAEATEIITDLLGHEPRHRGI